jgi:hypothetical protein
MSASLMSGPSAFRKFAEECAQMAKDASGAAQRARLMDMAEAWRRLAEEAERFEELVREMDEAFESPNPQDVEVQRRRSH